MFSRDVTKSRLLAYRTAGDAFKDANYASAIERPWPPLWKRILKHIVEVLS